MGYESKVYVCERNEHKDSRNNNVLWVYNEVIAAVDMCKMGYNNGWRELFNKELTGDFLGMDNGDETITEDLYGEALKYTEIDKVITWLENEMQKSDYRRLAVLYNMLRGFDINHWGNLIVVHYGY